MNSTDSIITKLGTYIVDPILLVIFAAGFFMFMWGLMQYMLNSASGGENVADGQRHMIYGTIGMFIMVSVYGIISLLDSTFGLNIATQNVNVNSVNTPTINFVGQ